MKTRHNLKAFMAKHRFHNVDGYSNESYAIVVVARSAKIAAKIADEYLSTTQSQGNPARRPELFDIRFLSDLVLDEAPES